MKVDIQTILNVCFAISVTLLIYQNTQLKERLSTLDLATLEMSIENDITLANLKSGQTMLKERVGIEVIPESKFGGEPVYWTVNERLTSYGLVVVENQSRLDTNESEIQAIAESIADIERSIRRLPKPKTTRDIKTIVNKCKTDFNDYMGEDTSWDKHRHTMKC
jgi:hypothetical protein